MLELPEIRTVSRQANEVLRGKTVAQVFPPTKRHRFAFHNEAPEHFGDLLVGRTLLACEGHGMFVDFNFSGGITMGTSDGVSLRYAEAGAPIPKDYQLLVAFDDDSFLVLTVRMYGFILISAAGHPGLITADMVKEGAVVIDVAVNRDEGGRLCGDVDYSPIAEKASYITPVPGGVGPVTRAVLMENTLNAALIHRKQ